MKGVTDPALVPANGTALSFKQPASPFFQLVLSLPVFAPSLPAFQLASAPSLPAFALFLLAFALFQAVFSSLTGILFSFLLLLFLLFKSHYFIFLFSMPLDFGYYSIS